VLATPAKQVARRGQPYEYNYCLIWADFSKPPPAGEPPLRVRGPDRGVRHKRPPEQPQEIGLLQVATGWPGGRVAAPLAAQTAA
jgi:hypothetical protein